MAAISAPFALPIRTIAPVSTATPTCGFLKLSAEIRNRIYSLVINADEAVNVYHTFRFTPTGMPYIQLRQPAIAATYRQIREESLSIYYSTLTFSIELHRDTVPNAWDVLASFFSAIGPKACKELTRIIIRIGSDRKCRLLDLIPVTRIFARPTECIPKVSSIFIDFAWYQNWQSWLADEWATELARDMAEIGRVLGERGLYDPEDAVIKAAVWFWRPAVNRLEDEFKCPTHRLWEKMEPGYVDGMEGWLFPLPEERVR